LRFTRLVLLYVYDRAQNITTYFDQGSVAHDFHGCMLRSAVPRKVAPLSMHPRPVVCRFKPAVRYGMRNVDFIDFRVNGGSVHGIVSVM
jgi:hypothetical protein